MDRRKRPSPQKTTPSSACSTKIKIKKSPIYTLGEVFPDGTCIELIKDPVTGNPLLLRDFSGAEQIEFRGTVYHPATINPSIIEAMQLPTKRGNYASTKQLFTDVRGLLHSCGFPEKISFVIPYFVFASWFPEFLPLAPCLYISGPQPETQAFLQLLGCLVRHPLPLREITKNGLCSLPKGLFPTLLIHQQEITKSTWHLLRGSNFRGNYILHNGTLLDPFCVKAIICRNVVDAYSSEDPLLQIDLLPSIGRFPLLAGKELRGISGDFQAAMLDYRCQNIAKVRGSHCDFPEFDSSIRMLGRTLGAAIVGAPELQADLEPLLRGYQEEIHSARAFDLRCIALEALLFHCHKQRNERVLIGQITKTVNAILNGRGENIEVEPEQVGRVLRRHGFTPTRNAKGFALRLDESVCLRTHEFAHRLRVATVQYEMGTCPLCKEFNVKDSKRQSKSGKD